MTRRTRKAAAVGGLPWYLSDLDVEVVGGGRGGRTSTMGTAGQASPSSPGANTADGGDGSDGSSNNNDDDGNRKRRDRPYDFVGNANDPNVPYVFVPADPASLAKGGGSGGRSASASRRRRGRSNAPTASFVAVLLGALTVFYFCYLRYTSKAVPSSEERPSKRVAAKVGGKRSKKSSRKKRQKDKKQTSLISEKQREVVVSTASQKEQAAAIIVKKEEEEKVEAATTTAVIVKKEDESDTELISLEPRTPKSPAIAKRDQIVNAHATPARSGASAAMQLATPKTPQEYKLHVEKIASVVSSTGLDKQQSLQIANEAVIRRLDYEMSQNNVMEREMRREEIEEQRREEDKREVDRRHKESLTAIKGEKRLFEKVIDARARCREMALQVFPGKIFLLCVSVALLSMFLCLNFTFVVREVYTAETNRTVLFALRRVCGCLDDGGNQQSDGSQLVSYYYSYLRYASDLCPSALSGYVFAPLSLWVGSMTCLASCAIRFGAFLAALGLSHRLLRMFHSIEFIHQAVNVVSISALLLAKMVHQSKHHTTSTELLWDLTAPMALANIFMAVTCVAVSSSKRFDDESLLRAERVDKKSLEKKLLYLTWLPSLVRVASTLVAMAVGIYWGTR